MEWDELEGRLHKLQQLEKQQPSLEQLQQQIRRRFADLSVGGVGGSMEELLDWLEKIDASEQDTEAYRYTLRTLGDIIDVGQGKLVRDSLEDIFRRLRQAIETLRKQAGDPR